MIERPIIFSSDSVRAILAGRKTQTRRLHGLEDVNAYLGMLEGSSTLGPLGYRGLLVSDYYLKASLKRAFKLNPGVFHWFLGISPNGEEINPIPVKCPYGQPGDRLWVREAVRCLPAGISYVADGVRADDDVATRDWWAEQFYRAKFGVRAIFVPRTISRITLEVVNIRVERLREIAPADAWAEGIEPPYYKTPGTIGGDWTVITCFEEVWDKLNAKRGYPWKSNPWVWVIEFKKFSADNLARNIQG